MSRLAVGIAVSCGLFAACAGGARIDRPPPPDIPTEAYVSGDGSDDGSGNEDEPFATIGRALESLRARIIVAPGYYREPAVTVTYPVEIAGPQAGRATLDGHLVVSSNDVDISYLNVRGGLAILLAQNVRVASATISAGERDDTVSLVSSEGRIEDLSLTCGPETCLQITTSTVVVRNIENRAMEFSKRGVRIETSSASLSGLTVEGGMIAQVQADLQTRVQLQDMRLSNSGGSGLVALKDTFMRARNIDIVGPTRFGALVQSSTLTLERSLITSPGTIGVGVSGGRAIVRSSTVTGAPDGTISLSIYSGQTAHVTLEDSLIEHGVFNGALVGGGLLEVERTHFVGVFEPPPGIEPGDGIVANGFQSRLDIRSAHLRAPGGFGISLVNQAFGTITATITGPGEGGIFVEGADVEPVRIRGTRVDDCRRGSGIVLLSSPRATVTDSRIERCPEAGVLAGIASTVVVNRTATVDNAAYGFAAFGGSTLTLQNSSARGSQWAAFAACGEDSRIEEDALNHLDGPVAACP